MTEAIHPHSSFSWIKHCRFLRLWILSSFINVISLILSKGKKKPKSKVSKHQAILISSTPFAHIFKSYGALFVKPGKSHCSLANSSSSGSRNSREVIMALLFVRLHLGITSLPFWAKRGWHSGASPVEGHKNTLRLGAQCIKSSWGSRTSLGRDSTASFS